MQTPAAGDVSVGAIRFEAQDPATKCVSITAEDEAICETLFDGTIFAGVTDVAVEDTKQNHTLSMVDVVLDAPTLAERVRKDHLYRFTDHRSGVVSVAGFAIYQAISGLEASAAAVVNGELTTIKRDFM
jgi:hypothetical protein